MCALELGKPIVDRGEMAQPDNVCRDGIIDRGR
jgi:hypothetical protein